MIYRQSFSDLSRNGVMDLFFFRHGVRNSLLLAPMPTASTAQILGNNESIEAYTSNIYSRRVLSGEFQVTNQKIRNVTGFIVKGIVV